MKTRVNCSSDSLIQSNFIPHPLISVIMDRTFYLAVAVWLLVACAACGGKGGQAPAANSSSNQNAGEAGAKPPPADLVRAEAQGVEMAAGGSAEAAVRLTIAEGYHITANPATLSYQIPTQVSVEPGEGITAGPPVYPPSLTRKFAFEPQPFAVYEKEAVIKLPLRAEASAPKGTHQLRLKLRVQACDDQSCYPPRNINTSVPVTVK
jgi:DsbC/DsbD-like thiol-disulfide interchange protein